jgi:hypothetical protein
LGYLSIAAHGHADALSFTLSAAGREILIDPGTYAYHTQKEWRDYFRGTAAHNTVRVDRQDQSVAAGNFLWRRHANANALEFNPSERVQRLVAEHDGYSRLSDSVLHRRELTLDVQTRILTVVDELVCGAEHEVEIFWHFAEDCELALEGKSLTARSGRVLVQAQMPDALAVEVHRGEESPPLGWISRSFDIRIPSATVRCAGEIRSTTRFVTRFSVTFEQNKTSMSPVTGTAATEVT